MDLAQPRPSVQSIDEEGGAPEHGAQPPAASPNPFGAAAVLQPFSSDESAVDPGLGAQPAAGAPGTCARLSASQASCGSIDEERAAEPTAAPGPEARGGPGPSAGGDPGPTAGAATPVPIPAAAGRGARRPRARLESPWTLPPAPGSGASPAAEPGAGAGPGPGSAGGSAGASVVAALPMSWQRGGGAAVMASPFKGFMDAPGSPRRAPDAPAEPGAGPDTSPASHPRPVPRPVSAAGSHALRASSLRPARSGPGDLSCRNAGAAQGQGRFASPAL